MEGEEGIDEMLLSRQTAEHLWSIGNYLSSPCPPASRICMSTLERKLNDFPDLLKITKTKMCCRHCGSIWNSESCKIRVLPRPRKNRHITKLEKIEANEPWKLNNRQKRKLRKFHESKSKVVYSCLTCKKKTIFQGSKARNIAYKPVESTSTPVPKIKINKGELNAGLFIPSPCSEKLLAKNDLEKSPGSTETPNSEKTAQKSNSKCTNKVFITSNNSFKNQTPPSLKSSPGRSRNLFNGKKKKTLLQQILNQEQNSKKKINLSSFLVSL